MAIASRFQHHIWVRS